MKTSSPLPSNRLSGPRVLLLSCLVWNAGFVLDHGLRWSNLFAGFFSGLLHVFVFSMPWVLFVLPWSYLMIRLYRWKKWSRFRTQWMLTPSILVFLFSIFSLISHPPTAQRRFQRFAETTLPQELEDLRYSFSGGGFADRLDIYSFRTTSKETARLISDMQLTEDANYGADGFKDAPISKLLGTPYFAQWEGAKLYRGSSKDGVRFTYLVTDASQTKVYIWVGSI